MSTVVDISALRVNPVTTSHLASITLDINPLNHVRYPVRINPFSAEIGI